MIYFSLHSNLYYLADTFFLIETGRKRKKYNKLKQKMKKGGKWQKERRREKSAVWYCCEMSWNDCRCWENSSFKHVLHTCVGVFKLSSHLKKKKEIKEKSSSIQQTGDLYIKTSWSREYKICFWQMLWKGWPTGYYHENEEISYCDRLESDRCGVLCRILFKSRL